MSGPLTDIKIDFLKQSLARFFDIDISFVDISAVRSDEEDKHIYRCELSLETPEKSLRRFHLSIYTFYIHPEDENGFIYEERYYKFDEMRSFMEKLTMQIKELNSN